MPERTQATDVLVDGSTFLGAGMDSFTAPWALPSAQYHYGENVVCRGGVVQTRPGTIISLLLPTGILQGAAFFRPQSGEPIFICAVNGAIYRSSYPYKSYTRVAGLQFSPTSRFVEFMQCVQSTDYTADGVPFALQLPRSVMIIQDGNSRAGYFDGITARHLNPEPSTGTTTVQGYDETKIGLHMAWCANRLWVARGTQVYASDYGNPTKFTESQYLNEGRAFYFPTDVTGLFALTNPNALLVFCEDSTHTLQAAVPDRTTWVSVPNFQDVLFPGIGCVAHRTLTYQYGYLWWLSRGGVISLDSSYNAQRSSRLDYVDKQMLFSKALLSQDLSQSCAGFYENFLMFSVPSGSRDNRHTWVLDQSSADGASAWSGVWTGWNPTQWLQVSADGYPRMYFTSRDYDGCNRLWQAFHPSRTDNGAPIDCCLITKMYDFRNVDLKRFLHAEVDVVEMLGPVSCMVCRSGEAGSWKRVAAWEMNATNGAINPQWLPGYNPIISHRVQVRSGMRTGADNGISTLCTPCNVESETLEVRQKYFMLMIAWSGRMGVASHRLFARSDPRPPDDAACVPDENGQRSVNVFGCSSFTGISGYFPFEVYSSVQTEMVTCPSTGESVAVSGYAYSFISQRNADYKATWQSLLGGRAVLTCPEDPLLLT